ncbi:glutamate receptor ionotropic, kainate 2-like [Euwallacea similis]|uniref:glutamate receptor ionotropic, kainate 2-like n=1 Tax=Euwallacea similis TaxID=1736056 RepID=UPI00344BC9BF
MDFELVLLWILSFAFRMGVGLSKVTINVGLITTSSEEIDYIDTNILSQNLDETFNVSLHRIILQEKELLASTNIYCNFTSQDHGLIAVVGLQRNDLAGTIKSLSNYLGIPYINTEWTAREKERLDTSFSVYPEASLLSQAFGVIIQSLNWDSFAVLYENEESIIKMQDVLKIQQHNVEATKNLLILKKIDDNNDNRHILKEVRATGFSHIVLDCGTDKILEILQQAKEVKLLDDVNTHIFITSLDAHILDYSSLETRSNITTIRLFDPNSALATENIKKAYPDVTPEKVTIKMALMYDAMLLLAESLNSIISDFHDETTFNPLYCNASEKYQSKEAIISAMQEVSISGITGEINLRNGHRNYFELNVIEINKRDKPIGLWNSNDPGKVVRTRNATERETELLQRLSQHNFIVTSRIGAPYLYKNDDPDLIGNARYYGYSMDLIGEIAKLLNISFKFQITQDNAYPNLQKDLIERRADLAICDFTVTPQRQEVIDFSLPFMTLGIGIVHKTEEVEDDSHLYAFMDPFSKVVWFYIGAFCLFMSFILVVIARLSKEDWENPHPCNQNPDELENIWDFNNCCWLTLGSITAQGCDILPKGKYTRIATASWWIFSLIITNSYIANLAAFLTSSKKVTTIDTVEELAQQSKVKYGCLKNGATASFFQYSNDTLYQRMWNTMINEKPSLFEDSNMNGVERVLSTKNGLYAFFMESTGIDYEMKRKCDLRRIGDLLDSKTYAIGMPLNADYRGSVNSAILRLSETGKLAELREKWWVRERDGPPCPTKIPVNSLALALENVGGVFIVLIAGIGLSFVVAIVQFLWNVYNITIEEHISYFQALKAEFKFACNIFVTRKRPKPVISESSSSKFDEEHLSGKGIVAGAGAVLNVNAAILNRIGSAVNLDEQQSKSKSTTRSKNSAL